MVVTALLHIEEGTLMHAEIASNLHDKDCSWDRVELKGLAEHYVIMYSEAVSRRRQAGNTVTVPWTENNVTISNLMPGVE